MLQSIRRISGALLAVGVLTLTLSVGQALVTACTSDSAACVANVMFGLESSSQMTFQPELTQSQSTPATNDQSLASDIAAIARAVGTQLIVLAVLLLIVLEFFELHYLRQLTKRRLISI